VVTKLAVFAFALAVITHSPFTVSLVKDTPYRLVGWL